MQRFIVAADSKSMTRLSPDLFRAFERPKSRREDTRLYTFSISIRLSGVRLKCENGGGAKCAKFSVARPVTCIVPLMHAAYMLDDQNNDCKSAY